MTNIFLFPDTDRKKVLVEARIFPIVCPKCDDTVPDLFHHKSSRYGFVGSVNCKCGASIAISDDDAEFVYRVTLKSSKKQREFNFKELYRFSEGNIGRIKRQYKIDVYQTFPNEKLNLDVLISRIEEFNGITVTPIETQIPLPLTIKKWFSLIDAQDIDLPKSVKF